MKNIHITKKGSEWVAKSGKTTIAKAEKKVDAIRKTASKARKLADAVSVKIHKTDGTFQEERTYPKTADPKKSKG